MKIRLGPRRLRLAFISTVLLFQQGCLCGGSHPGVELIDAGVLDLKRVAEADVRLTNVTAYRSAGVLRVRGSVVPVGTVGCIDIAVLAPDGTPLARTKSPVINERRYSRHHYKYYSTFDAELALSPPNGSLIRLVHRVGACDVNAKA